ncbi:MAG TPA: tyrosine-type recombinase/integrase [Chloroflexaceae bacterium]|nr:tyrosine-type recombinase/integrase [Chloroflexaceae bacterium]
MDRDDDLTTVEGAIRAFVAARRPRCVPGTLRCYRERLGDWLRWRRGRGPALADVTLAELRAYLAALGTRCRPRTVHNHYRALRALWRWLDGEGAVGPQQARFFVPGRLSLPPVVERERPAVTRAQVEQLLAGGDEGEEGARNRAIVLLLWESGLRVGELAALAQADVDLAERQARVIGKGSKEGYVFWGPRAAAALRRYLRVRRGPIAGPLFRGVSSRNNGGAMTANAVRLMLKRLAAATGVTLPKGAVVHGFRHGCARELRRRGCTREEVRDILRHEDLATTARYLGLDVEAPRSAHRRAFGSAEEGERRRQG